MSLQYPIADCITRIRNGQAADKKVVTMPSSKLKVAVLKVLKKEGYIKDFSIENNNNKPELSVDLKYYQGKPVIDEIKCVSRPSLRVYKSSDDLPKVAGFGISIISTSEGVMTGFDAREKGIGGEVLCTVK